MNIIYILKDLGKILGSMISGTLCFRYVFILVGCTSFLPSFILSLFLNSSFTFPVISSMPCNQKTPATFY